MKKLSLILTAFLIIVSNNLFSQDTPAPWKSDQLIAPAILAATINSNAELPLILNVGPAGSIKGAIDIGPANKEENYKKLKDLLATEKKDKDIVVYCGCCPYKNCPNIKPAFTLLGSLKFTNYKLLDLPKNLKVDWIAHGYPMNNQ